MPAVQAVATLPPSHDDPAEQSRQEERVVVAPPSVRLPAVHVKQTLAPGPLYFLSSSQATAPHR